MIDLSSNQKVSYLKGNCCGNTFILVMVPKNHKTYWEEKSAFAQKYIPIFKVDSVLFISESDYADINMEIFESNGSQSDTCGNGMLLLTHLLDKEQSTIETRAGIFEGETTVEKTTIHLPLKRVKIEGVPDHASYIFVKSGEPHLVQIVDDIDDNELMHDGNFFQQKFQAGVNVNKIKKVEDNIFEIRTFERGVNSTTDSCGTGTLSSFTALGYFFDKSFKEVVEFRSRGGTHWVTKNNGSIKLETLRSFCQVTNIDIKN